MTHTSINAVIDRIVTDDELRDLVLADGAPALGGFDLEPAEATAMVDALRADAGRAPFSHLRELVIFEPLFAAASASATKIG